MKISTSYPESLEKTLVLVKPDGQARHLTLLLLLELMECGTEIVAGRVCLPTADEITQHLGYDDDKRDKIGKEFIQDCARKNIALEETPFANATPHEIGTHLEESIKEYLQQGEVTLFILAGEGVIARAKELRGSTFPEDCSSDTLRGRLGEDDFATAAREGRAVRNIVHVAGHSSVDRQIKLWFPKLVANSV